MTDKPSETPPRVFTIGHSNHPIETLLELLREHQVEVVADVRSSPYSGYTPHFNKEAIERTLRERGIEYLFVGNMLGGRPPGEEFYDDDQHVLYDRLAESPGFKKGIETVLDAARSRRVALLCGEEDPVGCHRRLLVGRVLHAAGADIVHIRGDGRLQTEAHLAADEEFRRTKGQLTLFEPEETDAWRSTRSASRKGPQPSSSARSGEPESDG
jgi:uncharacterized protein (DUF488 family)